MNQSHLNIEKSEQLTMLKEFLEAQNEADGLMDIIRNPQFEFSLNLTSRMLNYHESQGFIRFHREGTAGKRRFSFVNAFSFPFGVGFRYDVSPKLTLRFEANKRTATTDYIDDVHEANWVDPNLFANYLSPSQAALARQLYNRSTIHTPPRNTRPRGHPLENDAYWTATFKVGINLNRSSSNSGIFGGATKRDMKKRLRCPSF